MGVCVPPPVSLGPCDCLWPLSCEKCVTSELDHVVTIVRSSRSVFLYALEAGGFSVSLGKSERRQNASQP